jgi:hypothetical protein
MSDVLSIDLQAVWNLTAPRFLDFVCSGIPVRGKNVERRAETGANVVAIALDFANLRENPTAERFLPVSINLIGVCIPRLFVLPQSSSTLPLKPYSQES